TDFHHCPGRPDCRPLSLFRQATLIGRRPAAFTPSVLDRFWVAAPPDVSVADALKCEAVARTLIDDAAQLLGEGDPHHPVEVDMRQRHRRGGPVVLRYLIGSRPWRRPGSTARSGRSTPPTTFLYYGCYVTS